ncbi:hypothetical protein NDU88_005172 [Pleurodeles waltl]|uniref:Uncharacterized protein n=1 Tax=Pleurodeles waltl TaxID=8319 RepID=A0AAV7LRF5_PLEWA|nr:hypothetical protein NDU88_005172 [Pleurodeles waltl]
MALSCPWPAPRLLKLDAMPVGQAGMPPTLSSRASEPGPDVFLASYYAFHFRARVGGYYFHLFEACHGTMRPEMFVGAAVPRPSAPNPVMVPGSCPRAYWQALHCCNTPRAAGLTLGLGGSV